MKMTTTELHYYKAAASLGLIADEENPIFLFNSTHKDILMDIVSGKIDPIQIASIEMRNRGLDLTTGENIGVRYGSSSLSTTNILLATDAGVAGEVAMGDNSKAVIFAFSGGSASNAAQGSIYYVEDVDAGAGQNFIVTLVGSMSSSLASITQMVNNGVYL